MTPTQQFIRDEICRRLSEGETLRSICRDDGFPSVATVCGWALRDDHGFAEHYAQAQRIGWLVMADGVRATALEPLMSTKVRRKRSFTEVGGQPAATVADVEEEETVEDNVAARRLKTDTEKWLLSKVLPKIYGDKIIQEVTGAEGKPLIPAPTNFKNLTDEELATLQALMEKANATQPPDA